MFILVTVLPSPKPSPSKRRCSEENARLTGEENKDPVTLGAQSLEPTTDKKPPIAPKIIHSTTVVGMSVHSSSPPDIETVVCSSQTVAESREIVENAIASTPSTNNMKSRLQRLAAQRQCWDYEATEGGNKSNLNSLF